VGKLITLAISLVKNLGFPPSLSIMFSLPNAQVFRVGSIPFATTKALGSVSILNLAI
jgi:hypothetical protein